MPSGFRRSSQPVRVSSCRRSQITKYAASCCGVAGSKDSDGSMRSSNSLSTCRSRLRRCGKQPRSGRTLVSGANRLPTTGRSMATSFSQPKSRPSGRQTGSSPRRTSVTFRVTLQRHSGATSARHDRPNRSVRITIGGSPTRRPPAVNMPPADQYPDSAPLRRDERACEIPRHGTTISGHRATTAAGSET